MTMEATTVPDRESLLARGDVLWKRLSAALDAHIGTPLSATTDWTGHDVYAHFARWQQLSIEAARELLGGRRPAKAEGHEDVLNPRWRAEDRGLATAVVRERCSATRAELRELLSAITQEQWLAWGHLVAADIGGQHHEHHLRDAGLDPDG